MSETGFYTVQRGDTLGKIAKRAGTTSIELAKINGLANPNRIEEGQKLALTRDAVCKVGFQFLDRDHNPLRHAKVRLEFCGKVIDTTSGEGGRTRDIITDSPLDTVKVWIARYDGGWKLITEIVSDWGNKLVTLTSPKIRIEASTHPHPQDSHGQPVKDKPRSPLPPAPAIPRETIAQGKLQSTFGDGKGTKVEETQDAQGLPVARVTSDQSKLEFLGDYTGEKITDDDYDRVAEELKIEPALLRAIALKETKGAAFDAQHRPRILYERHKFSKYSKHKFDKENPDISSRVRYTKKTKDKQGKPIPERDRYGKDDQYIRLMKAYVLDKRAALMACSWGKFQIMGFNHAACGFSSVEAFVKAISKSEVEHLQAVKGFIHVNCLQAARNLDFKAIARSFNGEKFYENNYDKDLYALYKKIKND